RRVEGFDDVDVDIVALGQRQHVLDHPRFVGGRRQRPFPHAPGARPADLADDDLLAGEGGGDLAADGSDMRAGGARGYGKVLPIWQNVDGDEVDRRGDVAV